MYKTEALSLGNICFHNAYTIKWLKIDLSTFNEATFVFQSTEPKLPVATYMYPSHNNRIKKKQKKKTHFEDRSIAPIS